MLIVVNVYSFAKAERGNKDYIYPYLNNGRGDVYEKQSGNYEYPFVLKVPEVLDADEHEFRWAIEGAPLKDAYNSITGDGGITETAQKASVFTSDKQNVKDWLESN